MTKRALLPLTLSCLSLLVAGCDAAPLDGGDELRSAQLCGPIDPNMASAAMQIVDQSWPEIVPEQVRAEWTPESEATLHAQLVERFNLLFVNMANEVDQLGCVDVLAPPDSQPDVPIATGYQIMLTALEQLAAAPNLSPVEALVVDNALIDVWEDATSSWDDVVALEAGTPLCEKNGSDWFTRCPPGTIHRAGDCDVGESTCGTVYFGNAKRCCDRSAGYMCQGGNSCVPAPGGGFGEILPEGGE